MDETGEPRRVPLLKNAHVITAAGPTRDVYLQHGGGVEALQGRDADIVIEAILPRVDGFTSATEIIAAVAQTGVATAERAAHILRWLIEAGICVEDRQEPEDGALRRHFQTQIHYFSRYSTCPTACQKRLQASRVAVVGLEYIGSVLVQHLAAAGVGHLRAIGNPCLLPAEAAYLGCAPHGAAPRSRHTLLARQARAGGFATHYEGRDVPPQTPLDWPALLADCNLAVLLLPAWQPSLVQAFNQACLSQEIPFLPVWLEGDSSHIGPLVIPYATACLLCLQVRQRSRWTPDDFRAVEQQHADATGPVWDACRLSIPWVSTVAAMTACEVVTALAQERQPASHGHTLCLSALHWQVQSSPVLKVPRCPACSRLRQRPSPQPFALHYQKEQPDGSVAELPQYA